MKFNDTNLSLAPQQVSIDVLLEKYAKGDEKTIADVRRRVARALAADCTLVRLAGCGHNMHWTRTTDLANLVLAFLESI